MNNPSLLNKHILLKPYKISTSQDSDVKIEYIDHHVKSKVGIAKHNNGAAG